MHIDFGRMGEIEGLFIADNEAINNLIDKEIYFGEILGKHSEVITTMKNNHFTLITDDEKVVDIFIKHNISSGYNPFDYLEEEEEEE